MQVRNDSAYVTGSGVLDLGQFGRGYARHLVDEIVLPDHYIYLTLDDYLGADVQQEFGFSDTSAKVADRLLRLYPARDLVAQLAFLNRVRELPDQLEQLRQAYIQAITKRAAARCEGLTSPQGTHPRMFLARQPILLAMREALLKNSPGMPQVPMPIGVGAVMLTHAIAAGLNSDAGGPSVWEGLPVAVLMEVVCNGSFNSTDDMPSRLDRLWRIYFEFDSAANPPARARFPKMAADALGADVGAIAAFGVLLDNAIGQWRWPDPVYNPELFVGGANRDVHSAFLAYVTAREEPLREALRKHQGPWGFLPLERAPVLRVDDQLLVLDREFLQRRVTEGVMWAVADNERKYHGEEKASRDWLRAYGQVVEASARSQIRSLAPSIPILGTKERASTYFSDADLIHAYPAPKKGKTPSQSDAVVWLSGSNCCLVFEIVSAELKLPTRQGQNLEAFRDDIERMVMKKLRQLDVTARNILSDQGLALFGYRAKGLSAQPILVQGGHFPVHEATIAFIDDQTRREGLLQHARAGIRPLAILHLDELDVVESIAQQNGDLLALFSEWQRSERKAQSLKNFLYSRGRNERPTRLSPQRWRTLLGELASRVAPPSAAAASGVLPISGRD